MERKRRYVIKNEEEFYFTDDLGKRRGHDLHTAFCANYEYEFDYNEYIL